MEQVVIDVPAKLAARVRLFDTVLGRKTDAHDAHSVAAVAVRTKTLRVLTVDGELEALRLLVDRRDALSRRRVQTVNRCIYLGRRMKRAVESRPVPRPSPVVATAAAIVAGPTTLLPPAGRHHKPQASPPDALLAGGSSASASRTPLRPGDDSRQTRRYPLPRGHVTRCGPTVGRAVATTLFREGRKVPGALGG